MIIMKFGGTSVGSSESIMRVRQIVKQHLAEQPVIVVSALGGVTNVLVDLSTSGQPADVIKQLKDRHLTVVDKLWPERNQTLVDYISQTIDQTYTDSQLLSLDEAKDRLLSAGETLSSRIVSEYLLEEFPAQQVLATDCIKTNDNFGSAEVIDEATKQAICNSLNSIIESRVVPVVTGFIGSTESGQVTTLGRGGSDYTAALLGHYIQAQEIQIWTDVDGVMSADPRIVEQADLIEIMTYEEAAELAAFGAKVLHPKTMRPAVHSGIPLRIANTFNPEAATTLVQSSVERSHEVVAVAAKENVVMVNIYAAEMLLQRGFLSRISALFAQHGISIDIVSATEVSVSITLDNDERLQTVIKELESFSRVTTYSDVGLVSLIGKDIAFSPALIAKVFRELDRIGITTQMISVGAEGVNVSLVVGSSQVTTAVRSLHELFKQRNDNGN